MGTTRAIVLGTAQDGGIPHVGCRCGRCATARSDPAAARRVACLGLVSADGEGFLIDATPDFSAQLDVLPMLSGLLLTHAHLGHVAGLLWLGTEAMATDGLPVWIGYRLLSHLERNEPWASLVRDKRIQPEILVAKREFPLTEDLHATAVAVPHRAEWSETFAFRVRGPGKTLLWLPDIDRFEDGVLDELLDGVDLALIDGTFWSPDELPERNLSEIPHPFVKETAAAVAALRPAGAVSFVHLNHSNPLLDAESPESRELSALYERSGLNPVGPTPVAADGLELTL